MKPLAEPKEPDVLLAHYGGEGERWWYRVDGFYAGAKRGEALAHAQPNSIVTLPGGMSAVIEEDVEESPIVARGACHAIALRVGFELTWEGGVGICRRFTHEEARERGAQAGAASISVRLPTALEMRGLMMIAASDPKLFKSKGPAEWISHAIAWIAREFELQVAGDELAAGDEPLVCALCSKAFLVGEIAFYRVDQATGAITAPVHVACSVPGKAAGDAG